MNIIAHIHTDLPDKFGVPRQSGLVTALKGRIVFTPDYRVPDALRGLETFSHLWLIWQFSRNIRESWSPTVRPPRLGGNHRLGVFATRSPFRPNGIGLSCVCLEKVDFEDKEGPVIHVAGVDMIDGTPILDIKPYIPYTDCHPEACEGFTDGLEDIILDIDFPEELRRFFTPVQVEALQGILTRDPRPRYQHAGERTYGMTFGEFNIRFKVKNGMVSVLGVVPKTLRNDGQG